MNIKVSSDILDEDLSEVSVIDYQKPVNHNWNCETPLRFKNKLIEKDYVLIYE